MLDTELKHFCAHRNGFSKGKILLPTSALNFINFDWKLDSVGPEMYEKSEHFLPILFLHTVWRTANTQMKDHTKEILLSLQKIWKHHSNFMRSWTAIQLIFYYNSNTFLCNFTGFSPRCLWSQYGIKVRKEKAMISPLSNHKSINFHHFLLLSQILVRGNCQWSSSPAHHSHPTYFLSTSTAA